MCTIIYNSYTTHMHTYMNNINYYMHICDYPVCKNDIKCSCMK